MKNLYKGAIDHKNNLSSIRIMKLSAIVLATALSSASAKRNSARGIKSPEVSVRSLGSMGGSSMGGSMTSMSSMSGSSDYDSEYSGSGKTGSSGYSGSGKTGNSGYFGSGKTGNSGDKNTNCYALDGSEPNDCVICDPCNKVKPDTLTLVYNPNGQNSAYQDESKATCRMSTYPSNPDYIVIMDKKGIPQETIGSLAVGDVFTIGVDWDFGSETNFAIDGWTSGSGPESNECFIHTSCSQPLVIGDQIGPFIIQQGNECYATPPGSPVIPSPVAPAPSSKPASSGSTNPNCNALDGSEPDDCVICDPCNKVKPDTLTLVYNPNGQNSAYQDESKATCRMSTYPSNPDYIVIMDKKGIPQETIGSLAVGDVFTIGVDWDFGSETNFAIDGWTSGSGPESNECFIHTSCSQPLVIGDQIGPFIIQQGNECYATPPGSPVIPSPVAPAPSSKPASSGSTNPNCNALDGSEPDDCVICNPCNKVKPDTLTLVYNPNGQNSAYQDESKATCRMSTYPSNPDYIVIMDKKGIPQETIGSLAVGDVFTIGVDWDFGSETNFAIDGWTSGSGPESNECFIHTSCSQPLVIGDQIGPFIIQQGNECYATPTASPVLLPTSIGQGNSAPPISSTVAPTSLPAPFPTSGSTSNPTSLPTIPLTSEPSSPPTPETASALTPNPTLAQTLAPISPPSPEPTFPVTISPTQDLTLVPTGSPVVGIATAPPTPMLAPITPPTSSPTDSPVAQTPVSASPIAESGNIAPVSPVDTPCGNGIVGNGICLSDRLCCSEDGFCGSSAEFCGMTPSAPPTRELSLPPLTPEPTLELSSNPTAPPTPEDNPPTPTQIFSPTFEPTSLSTASPSLITTSVPSMSAPSDQSVSNPTAAPTSAPTSQTTPPTTQAPVAVPSTRAPVVSPPVGSGNIAPSDTPCGNGNVGNGVCEDSMLCCSKFGWCGTSDEHCGIEASSTPTSKPNALPTVDPTPKPTLQPSAAPSTESSSLPTSEPTNPPSPEPTSSPTPKPTVPPTSAPSFQPTPEPTPPPTPLPTLNPISPSVPDSSFPPTSGPTGAPTLGPTLEPTPPPTEPPVVGTATVPPTHAFPPTQAPEASTPVAGSGNIPPVDTPCGNGNVGNGVCEDSMLCCSKFGWCGTSDEHCGIEASSTPTSKPNALPTVDPTPKPTLQPSAAPSTESSSLPTSEPTNPPSPKPTSSPTPKPTFPPTSAPSFQPTPEPTPPPSLPTLNPISPSVPDSSFPPTSGPTGAPTLGPTLEPTPPPTEPPVVGTATVPPTHACPPTQAPEASSPVTGSGNIPPVDTPCGNGNVGNGVCEDSMLCCSKIGWCGTSAEHCGIEVSSAPTPELNPTAGSGNIPTVRTPCGNGNIGNGICENSMLCCSRFGWCGTTSEHCATKVSSAPSPEPSPPVGSGNIAPSDTPCGNGNVGNGVCEDSMLCCSKFGWCGTSDEHCGIEASSTPTSKPSALPTVDPTPKPTLQPSAAPSTESSSLPTSEPTNPPSPEPTSSPTPKPTVPPTSAPSFQPTPEPTPPPTPLPTLNPIPPPSFPPTSGPTGAPTLGPTLEPTPPPTEPPVVGTATVPPTHACPPTRAPVVSSPVAGSGNIAPVDTPCGNGNVGNGVCEDSMLCCSKIGWCGTSDEHCGIEASSTPTSKPSALPTVDPTPKPTLQPSAAPSTESSSLPTSEPTNPPSPEPTSSPTPKPTFPPTSAPSFQPTPKPTPPPTSLPTLNPIPPPSFPPTPGPTGAPTLGPTLEPTPPPTEPPVVAIATAPPTHAFPPTQAPEASSPVAGSGNIAPVDIPCGNGNVGNGVCEDSMLCCSKIGWCGTSAEHCGIDVSSVPTSEPSALPTVDPTTKASLQPSASPTPNPSLSLSQQPSAAPSQDPSTLPTLPPSNKPTVSAITSPPIHDCPPTSQPTAAPTPAPTRAPTADSPTVGSGNVAPASPADTPCGNGVVGNGICEDIMLCCSTFGWCGTSAEHCGMEISSSPTAIPIILPTSPPSPSPTAKPSAFPTPSPTSSLSPQPSNSPSTVQTFQPTLPPSNTPVAIPTVKPTPLLSPCISVDKASYLCNESISVFFNFDSPLIDDWIGIYPSDTNATAYYYAKVWQWTCGDSPLTCTRALSDGKVVFAGLPKYNEYGINHDWPITSGTYKAVLLREDGPSVPPYVSVCESAEFEITSSDAEGCSTPTISPTPLPSAAVAAIVTALPISTLPTTMPSTPQTLAPIGPVTPLTTAPMTVEPAFPPTQAPTFPPTLEPTYLLTPEPSSLPSKSMSDATPAPAADSPTAGLSSPGPSPTAVSPAPIEPECLVVNEQYDCGANISVSFIFPETATEGPLIDDWIGIYPCSVTGLFYNAIVWQWACGDRPSNCVGPASSGSITFDSLPSYNQAGPHTWPVVPSRDEDGVLNTCFKAVYLRNDGPSVPPYVTLCESANFTVNESTSEGCIDETASPVVSLRTAAPVTPAPSTAAPNTLAPFGDIPTAGSGMAPVSSPAPTDAECVYVDGINIQCGAPITFTFSFPSDKVALIDDWLGIYPCDTEIFFHANVWQWACGDNPYTSCTEPATNGTRVFDQLPTYNEAGPHTWPVSPFYNNDGSTNRCFQIAYLRSDGPSVPPYVKVCSSNQFFIEENDSTGCGIRASNSD